MKYFNKLRNNKYINDYFKLESKKLNLYSRSWFKINEIQKKFNIIKYNMNIVDLGCYPGGWSKYFSDYISINNTVYSCDIKNMKSFDKIKFFNGNLIKKESYNNFIKFINKNTINIIASDMLFNTSGHKIIDNNNNYKLLNISFNLCLSILTKNGTLIAKSLEGNHIKKFIKKINFFLKKFIFLNQYLQENFLENFIL